MRLSPGSSCRLFGHLKGSLALGRGRVDLRSIERLDLDRIVRDVDIDALQVRCPVRYGCVSIVCSTRSFREYH
jgi:hypothetical protein